MLTIQLVLLCIQGSHLSQGLPLRREQTYIAEGGLQDVQWQSTSSYISGPCFVSQSPLSIAKMNADEVRWIAESHALPVSWL